MSYTSIKLLKSFSVFSAAQEKADRPQLPASSHLASGAAGLQTERESQRRKRLPCGQRFWLSERWPVSWGLSWRKQSSRHRPGGWETDGAGGSRMALTPRKEGNEGGGRAASAAEAAGDDEPQTTPVKSHGHQQKTPFQK